MTPTDSRADLAIIGSGSAAFAAAIAATNLGKRVVMVERGTVGGTCVNVGCVPSKALLAAAEARHTAAAAGRFPGLTAATVPVDFADLIAGKDALVEHLRTDKYVDLATDYGWEIVSGTAVFDGAPATPALRVELTGGGTRVIEADHYLIATGASPSVPPVAGLAEAGYLTSTTAMDLTTLPETLIGADPEYFLRHHVDGQSKTPGSTPPELFAEYLRCYADPACRHAICEDYRAAAGIDLEHDAADAEARITAPLLALWGAKGVVGRTYDVLETWREKATDVSGRALDCGHTLQEERPDAVLSELAAFLR